MKGLLIAICVLFLSQTGTAENINEWSVPRPTEYAVSFVESDFETKPWLKDFEFVIVVNRAIEGRESQTIKIYRRGQSVALNEITVFEGALNDREMNSQVKADRIRRIKELSTKLRDGNTNLFKVSTGRNAFEKKGEHHSQRDSWSVTPTGFYVPKMLHPKYKSENYSSDLCGSFAGKFLGAFTKKSFCTHMENAIFFSGGVALHKAIPGTEPVLGKKASGGCVRLPAALAEYLFNNVNSTQSPNVTKIPVVNPDGTLQFDASGQPAYSTTVKSVWGTKPAWSSLIIVQDRVVEN